MTTMITEVYTALKSAGAPENEAAAAAEAVASFDTRFHSIETKLTTLQWMVGLIIIAEAVPFL
jgi:hypothetical protein